MLITAQCPSCGKKGSVPAAFQGRQVTCPGCGQPFAVVVGQPSSAPGVPKPTSPSKQGVAKPASSSQGSPKPLSPSSPGGPKPVLKSAGSTAEGRTIGAGYRLVSRIGKGSFSEVWKGEAPGGIAVAIKILAVPPDHADARAELTALELIKNLRHPFLLQTQACWTQKDRIVIVTELADGSLRGQLQAAKQHGQTIPPADLLRWFRQAADALDYLHQQGVMHRDVKPENILLIGGHAKLADMGLARRQYDGPTGINHGAGTANYLAPEAWDGRVSPQSDLYALAASYAELRLQRLLFTGGGERAIKKAHFEVPPDLAGISMAEQAVLRQALAKRPHDRPSSCQAFVTQLEEAIPRGMLEAPPAQRLPVIEPLPAPADVGLELPDEIGLASGPPAKTFDGPSPDDEEVIEAVVEVAAKPKPRPAPKPAASPFGSLPTSTVRAAPARAKPKESTTLVICIAAGVGGLLMIGLVGYLLTRPGAAGPTDTHAKAATKRDERSLPTAVAKKAEPPVPPPPEKEVPVWADASSEGQKLGPVRVRVTAVEVDHVFAADAVGPDKQLIIRLIIENASNAQRVKYQGWGVAESGPQLRDDLGNTYARVRFDKPETIDGLVMEREFAPSVQFNDMLVFPLPKAEWQTLYLELPAINYGQLGTLRFQIPESMLAFAQPTPDVPMPMLTPPEEKHILALRQALRDKKATAVARQRTADSLRGLGVKAYSAAHDLGQALEDESEAVRLAAAQALVELGPLARPALPALTSALQDEFWRVRAAAARALGNIGPPAKDALPRLKALLKSKDEEVPAAASEAIKKIQGRPLKP